MIKTILPTSGVGISVTENHSTLTRPFSSGVLSNVVIIVWPTELSEAVKHVSPHLSGIPEVNIIIILQKVFTCSDPVSQSAKKTDGMTVFLRFWDLRL